MSLADDLGGADKLNEPQRALVRQVAAVTVESEKLQACIVKGEKVDHENLVRLNNLQARLMKQLDIKPTRKPKRSLQSFMAENAA